VSERQRVEQAVVTPEQAGRLHHNENGGARHNGTPSREAATPAAGDRRPPMGGHGGRRSCDAAMPGTAARIPVAAKTAPVAQPIDVRSNPQVQKPKPAILAGKAGAAIKRACDSALQDVQNVTECGGAECFAAGGGSGIVRVTDSVRKTWWVSRPTLHKTAL
jgi:hypothetical protein